MCCVRRQQQRPQVFEGVCKGLWKRKADIWVVPLELLFLEEGWAAARVSTKDIGSIVDPIFPQGASFWSSSVAGREGLCFQ